jgi:hypothetical protein
VEAAVNVFFQSNYLHVIGIDAPTISAQVVERHVGRNVPNQERKGNTMRRQYMLTLRRIGR